MELRKMSWKMLKWRLRTVVFPNKERDGNKLFLHSERCSLVVAYTVGCGFLWSGRRAWRRECRSCTVIDVGMVKGDENMVFAQW